jgi:hypothetical protein
MNRQNLLQQTWDSYLKAVTDAAVAHFNNQSESLRTSTESATDPPHDSSASASAAIGGPTTSSHSQSPYDFSRLSTSCIEYAFAQVDVSEYTVTEASHSPSTTASSSSLQANNSALPERATNGFLFHASLNEAGSTWVTLPSVPYQIRYRYQYRRTIWASAHKTGPKHQKCIDYLSTSLVYLNRAGHLFSFFGCLLLPYLASLENGDYTRQFESDMF